MPARSPRRDMIELSLRADILCLHILRRDVPDVDIEIERRRLRERAQELFPDRMDLYDMIYESRFDRLCEQFRSRRSDDD